LTRGFVTRVINKNMIWSHFIGKILFMCSILIAMYEVSSPQTSIGFSEFSKIYFEYATYITFAMFITIYSYRPILHKVQRWYSKLKLIPMNTDYVFYTIVLYFCAMEGLTLLFVMWATKLFILTKIRISVFGRRKEVRLRCDY